MIKQTTKLRWRRRLRRHKKQVEGMGAQADEGLERHFLKRIGRLPNVRRFVATWTALLLLLIAGVIYQLRALEGSYLSLKPVPGGIYNEGMLGTFSNANPVYAVNSVDASAARLVFAGLFTYNTKNQLVGDLASGFKVDAQGVNYTVRLKPDLKWQDGRPLTAADVVFTYQTIQNPDAGSPLESSWRNIKVTAPDPRTVLFNIPNALSSFPYAMTNGIIPKHLLTGIPPQQLRSVAFNTVNPVGAGPFKWKAIETQGTVAEERIQRIAFEPNELYHAGPPKLSGLVLTAFRNENQLVDSFRSRELEGMAGLGTVPEEFEDDLNVQTRNIPLTGEVMVFFKTSQEVLNDVKVRQALVRAADTKAIVAGLGYPAIPADQPLLRGQLGYNPGLAQHGYNVAEANRLLDEAGWAKGPDGVRAKDGKKLNFKLFSQSNSEYAYVTQALQKQWKAVGVDAEVFLQPDTNLQTTINFHAYDALVYGITIGADPDVFPYWHSTQADIRSSNRFNFSEYNSKVADQGLEGGRTRDDVSTRSVKYHGFLAAWRDDAPGLALYQPRFLYITRGQLFGLDQTRLNVGADRFNNVANWMIVQAKSTD